MKDEVSMKDTNQDNTNPTDVVSLDTFRNRKNEEKKRKAERIFFQHLMGVYSVVPPGKLIPVDIIDVSEEGLAIQVPYQSEKIWPVDINNIPIRLYFSPESFMEIVVDIKNSKATIEGGSRYVRYGCAVQSEHRSYDAWTKFVGFLRTYAEVSERDSGNISVGNI
jgi:hypothetical protein